MRVARSLGLISCVSIPPPRILHVPAVLSDGTVLTEPELVPALLMRNKVELLLAGGNVSFLGSSSEMIYKKLVGMDCHTLLI